MECSLCGHTETLVYGKTDKGELQRICPACHEILQIALSILRLGLICYGSAIDPSQKLHQKLNHQKLNQSVGQIYLLMLGLWQLLRLLSAAGCRHSPHLK